MSLTTQVCTTVYFNVLCYFESLLLSMEFEVVFVVVSVVGFW